MIQGFADTDTAHIWSGRYVRRYPRALQDKAYRKLVYLDSAAELGDLRFPPGNRLEKLKGRLRDYYSIRVDGRYRIWFRWGPRGPQDVTFGDYHD
jgi:toxin HigB-1